MHERIPATATGDMSYIKSIQNNFKPSFTNFSSYLIVTMKGVECHRSFSHMNQTLCNPDHEQVIGVFGMVLGKLNAIFPNIA